MVPEWVGVEDSGGNGASWGVSFGNKLRRSYKSPQEKHDTGKVSEPLSGYLLWARSQAEYAHCGELETGRQPGRDWHPEPLLHGLLAGEFSVVL